jgi:uncharacterized protein YegL
VPDFEGEGERFDVAPFVLVVDESGSMESVVGTVNTWIPQLIATMRDIPEARESVALGVVSFNSSAEVRRRISWLGEDATAFRFTASNRTSYVAPLEQTRSLIEEDVPQLGAHGWRPVVFFITDGYPNVGAEEDWVAARDRLLSPTFRLRPRLVPLGFGKIDLTTLRKLASDPELATYTGADPQVALDEILQVVLNTIITLTDDGSGGASVEQPVTLAERIRAAEAKTISYVD